MTLRLRDGSSLRVEVSVVVVPNGDSRAFEIIHLVRPCDQWSLSRPEQAGDEQETLTRRELEALRLVAEGKNTRKIADEMGISLSTVRKHVQNLMRKLGAKTRLSAVLTAIERRLL